MTTQKPGDAEPSRPQGALMAEALELMHEVETSDLERDLSEAKPETGWAKRAVTSLLKALSDADAEAAALRVARLREAQPERGRGALADQIIEKKVRQTAAIGAASSGAALVPVLGTLSAMTVGVAADITATFKLQAEMVLELAAAYDFPLGELDEQKVIFLVTGVSTGGNVLLNRVGKELSIKLSERYAQKWLATALPFIGVAVSSSTNGLATYVIGQRAQVYFRDGPEAVADWKGSLRALSGVDERRLGSWLSETSGKTWEALSSGASRTGDLLTGAATATGSAVVSAGRMVGEGVSEAASSVAAATGQVAGRVGDALKTPWRKEEDEAES